MLTGKHPLARQRPREHLSDEQCKLIARIASTLSIPVIANGGSLDIKEYSDIAPFMVSD